MEKVTILEIWKADGSGEKMEGTAMERPPADAAQPAVAAVALPALGTALTFGADSPGSEWKLSLGFIP